MMIYMDFKNYEWNNKDYKNYINYLKSIKDIKYLEFNKKIVKTKYEMIGIPIPILKKISKNISKSNIDNYFKYNKIKYYEELMIYGLVLSYNEKYLDKYLVSFINKIDNWAICDTFVSSLKIINKKKGKYWIYFNNLIDLNKEYNTRVSIVVFMNYYLNDDYIDRVLYIVSNIKTDYYYINMSISWLLSIAIINYKDKVINLLSSKVLNKFVQNKTISKIQDSYRIDKSLKNYVKQFKI